MNLLCVDFIVSFFVFIKYMHAGKTLLNCTNLFSSNDYKKIVYIYIKIKHNDLICEKYKKTCEYLNYAEHLLM